MIAWALLGGSPGGRRWWLRRGAGGGGHDGLDGDGEVLLPLSRAR